MTQENINSLINDLMAALDYERDLAAFRAGE